jgi:hypothetical protein
MSSIVTVLRCEVGKVATNIFVWSDSLGEWSKRSFQAGSWFHPEEVPIASLMDLAKLIEKISLDPRTFIVRGGPNRLVRSCRNIQILLRSVAENINEGMRSRA